VRAGCGCIVANFDKAIPPGQEGKITLKINTRNRKGKLRQYANIFSNDPQNPKTKISINGLITDVPGRNMYNFLINRQKCLFLAEICSH